MCITVYIGVVGGRHRGRCISSRPADHRAITICFSARPAVKSQGLNHPSRGHTTARLCCVHPAVLVACPPPRSLSLSVHWSHVYIRSAPSRAARMWSASTHAHVYIYMYVQCTGHSTLECDARSAIRSSRLIWREFYVSLEHVLISIVSRGSLIQPYIMQLYSLKFVHNAKLIIHVARKAPCEY